MKTNRRANVTTIQQLPNGQIILNVPRAIAQENNYQKRDRIAFVRAGEGILLQKESATVK